MARYWSTLAWGIFFLAPMFCTAQNTDSASLGQIETQAAKILDQSVHAVVRVHAYAEANSKTAVPPYRVSTGFIIDAKGWVATTASNITGADRIVIEWRGKKYVGVKLGLDPIANYALLRFDIEPVRGFQPLALSNSSALKAGQFVMAVGFPYDKPAASRWGNLDGIHTRRGDVIFPVAHISSNVKVSPGQSGSPLLNFKGEVIGVIVASPNQDETYALPSNAMKKLNADFIAAGRPRNGWSGLNAKNQDMPLDKQGITQRRPIVANIFHNSPASEADLQKGDVLLRFDGVELTDIADILDFMFYKHNGDSVRLMIQRGSETKTVSLKLAERPVNLPSFERPSHQPTQPPPIEPPVPPVTVPAFSNPP